MNELAGRSCPVAYRYGAQALASSSVRQAEVLYVVGGLYGNLQALERIQGMIDAETAPVCLVFNGDFNWFNVDDENFERVNRIVLQHDAILGNVEFELNARHDDVGCGCAYPDSVDDATVERSNRIHARLKATAGRHPHILGRLASMPMFRRYAVGCKTVGVVHGDAESLAGWMFDAVGMGKPENQRRISRLFARSQVDIFASTHTCLPALRRFRLENGHSGIVVNNGAAGMPNFRDQPGGLLTRISVHPSPHPRLYGVDFDGVRIDCLQIDYDRALWEKSFLDNWPPGSDAYRSYYSRLVHGPDFTLAQASG